jgi:hypothetical protein
VDSGASAVGRNVPFPQGATNEDLPLSAPAWCNNGICGIRAAVSYSVALFGFGAPSSNDSAQSIHIS